MPMRGHDQRRRRERDLRPTHETRPAGDRAGLDGGPPILSGRAGAHEHRSLLEQVGRRHGLSRIQLAYVLATALHETRMGRVMTEDGTGWGDEFCYELGNVERGDGNRFRGRGYVRLRGRRGYQEWADRLQLPLTTRPDLAARPDVAAEIAVVGMIEGALTGERLADYLGPEVRDLIGARRVVWRPRRRPAIRHRADVVARHAREFEASLVNIC